MTKQIPPARLFITKSRSGHYSVTASSGGFKRTISKLSSLGRAQLEGPAILAEVQAKIDAWNAKNAAN